MLTETGLTSLVMVLLKKPILEGILEVDMAEVCTPNPLVRGKRLLDVPSSLAWFVPLV